MTSRAEPPDGAISRQQWLINQINAPGLICGPPVIDDRAWWQHIPGLNPHAELEARLREAQRAARASVHEAEAG
jgi:hypothetical protein